MLVFSLTYKSRLFYTHISKREFLPVDLAPGRSNSRSYLSDAVRFGVDYDGTTDEIAQENLSSSQSYLDLTADFTFMENYDVIIGVNNVFDKEPPMVGGSLSGWGNANTISGFYDSLGRFLFTKITMRF